MPAHIPTHTIGELRAITSRKAVVSAYEKEVEYYADMGTVMPELDHEHREDVEIAVADMERQQVRRRVPASADN